ncbi:MAG: hypothetical protein H0U95_09055 [Bacteroidetes bacterium]|nr:hypothetical protein [Bacteroidota bacterium]
MRTITLFIFILSCRLHGQGFYDSNDLIIGSKYIQKANATSVIGVTEYKDSSFHPMSNFVLEYKFDNTGAIIKRKYWQTDIKGKGSKNMLISLVYDSLYSVPEYPDFSRFRCYKQSPVVKFNQDRNRTKSYVNGVFNELELVKPKIKNCWVRIIDKREILGDTIILGRQVSVPKSLFPIGDSVVKKLDTLIIYRKGNSSMSLDNKIYIDNDGSIKIDYYTNSTIEPFRSYFINSSGLLYKENQNIYSTLYYFTPDKLHVMTETYQYKTRTSRTTFIYKFGKP